ncbi:hypothetical protein THIOKS1980003 [Thiocapsa sp. KS1]|nr:hypothetical protein THIOKS1980003 [Thiocapsa sp. KS1]
MRLYLDLCCFNRPYDDQTQTRIRLETEAKILIQEKVKRSECDLVWSLSEVLKVLPPGEALAMLEHWYDN